MKTRFLRPAVVILLCLLSTPVVWAVVTAGNSVAAGSSDTNNVLTSGAISTVGATLFVSGIGSYQGGITQAVMADQPGGGASNTWTQTTARNSTNMRVRIAYASSPTTNASHTFTTVNGNVVYPALSAQAFLGTATSSPFDVENGANTGSANTLATGTVTPSADGAVLYACLAIGIAETPTMGGSGWSTPVGALYTAPNEGVWCSYKIQTTATTEGATFNWTTATEAAASVTAFKAPGGGGGGSTPAGAMLLGVR